MSRFAQSKMTTVQTAPAVKRDTKLGVVQSPDDFCPSCRTKRNQMPFMRLFVNPECYHRMCEACVDRNFSHGPATCPIPGCGRTLRKHRFREQTFDDIKVEREIDIRKRVARIFNQREEDFESLLAYNDHLNDVEDWTFNLINGIDVEDTNRKLEAYARAHNQEIEQNAQMAVQEKESFSVKEKLDKEQAKERRAAARREAQEEKHEVIENRKDVLNRLASGADAETVAKEGQLVQLKKRMDRETAAERQRQLQAAGGGRGGIVIKGLKSKAKAEPEAPVDPFGGLRLVDSYFTMQNEYLWEGIREAKKDIKQVAGGYDVRDYAHRSLLAAFGGLGVFVADDVTEREKMVQGEEGVGSSRADIAVAPS
ncbi:TFIIH/NER complex subunit [Elasticomyces elasticus]|nr:TFIIH/NER complex subunit [Elasticomyces elasticus]